MPDNVRKSVKKRITITKRGKVLRRAAASTHSKTRKSNKNLMRKKKRRELNYPEKKILNY